jgi:hypothetical protein
MLPLPIVNFDPAKVDGPWWALLPSRVVIRSNTVTDLIARVELGAEGGVRQGLVVGDPARVVDGGLVPASQGA